LPAKILVTTQNGGSRVALIGRSGKPLLTSEVFREPRAKGATVRALKGLLGDQVTVVDYTLASRGPSTARRTLNGKAATATRSRGRKASSATKNSAAAGARRQPRATGASTGGRRRSGRVSKQA
jgi:hypothetical protein